MSSSIQNIQHPQHTEKIYSASKELRSLCFLLCVCMNSMVETNYINSSIARRFCSFCFFSLYIHHSCSCQHFNLTNKAAICWIYLAYCSHRNGVSWCFSYIHGDGKVTRNFLYVSDVVDAFDVILHRGSPGSTYNIGTPFEISVIELARYLIQKVVATYVLYHFYLAILTVYVMALACSVYLTVYLSIPCSLNLKQKGKPKFVWTFFRAEVVHVLFIFYLIWSKMRVRELMVRVVGSKL